MISIHEGRTKHSLNGVWRYRVEEKEPGEALGYYKRDTDFQSWKEMKIPTNWYLTELGDFFGTVWFQTSFTVPQSFHGKKLFIRFAAVDYYADVWLNGQYLGSHEGMFNPFEFDVTDIVDLNGENILVVKDGAPRDGTDYIQAEFNADPLSTPYKRHQARAINQIKGHMIDAMHKPGAMTSFRDDGNSGGIWGDVELIARPHVYVDFVKIYTKIGIKKDWLGDQLDKPDGTAIVAADVTVNNTTGQVIRTNLDMNIVPYNFEENLSLNRSRQVVLQPGLNTFKLVITVPDARLWWTWDLGHPSMYTATVSVMEDTVKQNFGIKEVVHEEDTGHFYLNGKKLFLRGMRYITSQWLSEADPNLWREDLNKMLEMEINSIRIGSHVEPDGFYTLCDEMGFLVWQVFPLHYCVSDSDDFIERASEMIRDMGLMLCNHASLGMWSVFKEPEIYFLPDKPNNVHRLCQILKETLGTVDPVRWIHIGDYREGVQNLMIGACADGDTDLSTKKIEPIIVEFGAQSVPVVESLKQFIPEDKLWPPHWDTWEYYGFFSNLAFGFAKIEMKDTLEEFIDHYQSYEALVVKEQVEFLRQKKYRPVGSMYLYYWRDSCPVMGSGLFDYYNRPYKVYDSLKSVYSRVLISLERNVKPYIIGREKFYDRASTFTAKVWVTNDYFHAIDNASISWRIVEQQTGNVVLENRFTAKLAQDSAVAVDQIVWQIPADAPTGTYRIEMQVVDGSGNPLSVNYTDITVR